MTSRTGHHNHGIVQEPTAIPVYRRTGNIVEFNGFSELKEGQCYIVVNTRPLRLEEIFPEEVFSQLSSEEAGNLKINFAARKATVDDQPVVFTKTEWKILEVLFQNKGNLITYPYLIKKVWDIDPEELQLVRVWISRIRTKVPDIPLYTVIGQGLRLDA